VKEIRFAQSRGEFVERNGQLPLIRSALVLLQGLLGDEESHHLALGDLHGREVLDRVGVSVGVERGMYSTGRSRRSRMNASRA